MYNRYRHLVKVYSIWLKSRANTGLKVIFNTSGVEETPLPFVDLLLASTIKFRRKNANANL